MANVNYYVTPTTYVVNSGENWGEQDIDYDSISDSGLLPLEMKIYANPDYNVDASYFTIKGYEPTSTGINGERIWEQGSTTTDADGNEVTNIQLGGEFTNDVNKVIISNPNVPINSIWPNGILLNSGTGLNCGTLAVFIENSNLPFPTDSTACLEFNWGSAWAFLNNPLISAFSPSDIIYPDENTSVDNSDYIGAFYLENDQYIFAGGRTVGNQASGQTNSLWHVYQRTSSNNRGFEIGQEMHFFIFMNLIDGTRKTYKVEFEFAASSGDYLVNPNENGFQSASGQVLSCSTCDQPFATSKGRMIATGINSIVLYQDENAPGGYFGGSTGSFVKVEAWLNSTYNIIGSNDIQLYLDIDGDAQPNDNTPEQLETQFSITLKLNGGENSNAIIEANTDFYGNALDDVNIPQWFVESINIDDYTAKLLFTKNPYYADLPPQPLAFSEATTFIIRPKNGYSVCKDNFWIETVGDYTTNSFTYGGPNTSNDPQSNPTLLPSAIAYALDSSGNVKVQHRDVSSGVMDIYSDPNYYYSYTYNAYDNETYSGTQWWWLDRVRNFKVGLQDGNNIDYINISNLVESEIQLRNTWLHDDTSQLIPNPEGFQGSYEDYLPQNMPWTWDENYPIRTSDLLNPMDWMDNSVIIVLGTGTYNFADYQPENNLQTGTNIPKNFVINIEGSAMEIQTGGMPSVNINGLITEEIN